MFSTKDIEQIKAQDIEVSTIEQQIQYFKSGFPFLDITKAATVKNGIIRLTKGKAKQFSESYESQINQISIQKFVPASGAATRMFKSLFAFKDDGKSDKSIEQFCDELERFAFYTDLKAAMEAKGAKIEAKNFRESAAFLLEEKGLDYGNLPKGLLKFHKYGKNTRTPIEEHIVEGVNYANADGIINLHFTVSPEHRSRFDALVKKVKKKYEKKHIVTINITFSEQKSSTDTIAVNPDDTPFRNNDGSLLFRPAGHGALLANLNDQDGDVVFIKNVDNVVPDKLKKQTFLYKKALAGVLLETRSKIFNFIERIDNEENQTDENLLKDLKKFFEKELCTLPPNGFGNWSRKRKLNYYSNKLNRPIRVCGMVKNEGEPGGGPFWAKNQDESISLQIAESAQINLKNAEQKAIFDAASHFNPVDLVCTLRGFNGKKFDLMEHRDLTTGFISEKSKDGKDLKAQELPGLWNGSMADWNTIFVEVPLVTFNPVKTVNDLLRKEHQ